MNGKKVRFDQKQKIGVKFFALNQGTGDALSVFGVGRDQQMVVRDVLEGLNAVVDVGGQFNKFDRKIKNKQCDGLYLLDIIWKMRQIKKELA